MDFRKSDHFKMESEKLINSRPLILSQFVRLDNLKTLNESDRDGKIEECLQFIERLKSLCENSTFISEGLPLCKRIEDLYRDEFGELYQQLANANEDFIKNGEDVDTDRGKVVKDFYAENPLELNENQLIDFQKHYNKDYSTAIQIFQFLNILLINGIRQVNLHCVSSVEKIKKSNPISQGDQNLTIDNEETDLDTIILAEADGQKILLLHELGIIDYLIKKYNQNDITDIATLLSFITGINHNTARSGIGQYKTQGKGDVYNRTSVKAINKILLDARMTPIEFIKA